MLWGSPKRRPSNSPSDPFKHHWKVGGPWGLATSTGASERNRVKGNMFFLKCFFYPFSLDFDAVSMFQVPLPWREENPWSFCLSGLLSSKLVFVMSLGCTNVCHHDFTRNLRIWISLNKFEFLKYNSMSHCHVWKRHPLTKKSQSPDRYSKSM